MKRLAKIVAISMALFVGCAFVIPAQLGTLDSHAAKVSISKTKVTLVKGKTTTLTMKGTKSKAKWSSTNKSVATVTSSGKVTAKKAGKATIVAKISSKQYKCAVTVKNPTTTITKQKLTLYSGEVNFLSAISDGVRSSMKWKSSDPNVVSIDNYYGKYKNMVRIIAKKSGTVKIYGTMNGSTDSCTVTVKTIEGTTQQPSDPSKGVSITTDQGSFYFQLERMYTDEHAIYQLQRMNEWGSYDTRQYNGLLNHTFVLLEYNVKVTDGYNATPLGGLKIINTHGLFDSNCDTKIDDTDFKSFMGPYKSKTPVYFKLHNGESSKMYATVYIPNTNSSFTNWISSSGTLSQHWVKYDLY